MKLIKPTILFLCPHNAAKSVIAAAYFNQLAEQSALLVTADSAGTEPSEAVPALVVALLAKDGIDVAHYQPRQVTADDLRDAERIISMGCTPEVLAIAPERIELWSDVPPLSQEPDRASAIIRAHVEQLINEWIATP